MTPIGILAIIVLSVLGYYLATSGQIKATLGGPASLGVPQVVKDIATAISVAEGFGEPNAIPTLANNPGDLADPNHIFNWPGDTGQRMGSAGIVVFATLTDGWNQLFRQIIAWLNGTSSEVQPSYTIETLGAVYANDPTNWPSNVVGALSGLGYSLPNGTQTQLNQIGA